MQTEEKRHEIDAIDRAILDLLNRRAAIAKDISRIKLSAGLPIVDQQLARARFCGTSCRQTQA